MGFSAILLRWISRSAAAGVSRTSGIAADANSNYSLWELAAANRMISSSASGASSSESASSAPWAMMPPFDHGSGVSHRFYCVAEKEAYTFFTNDDSAYGYKTVGSSHGWLTLYNPKNHHLLLSDPVTDRFVKLPPADTVVHRVILGEEEGSLAFITLGSSGDGGLAFFSRRRRYGWTPLVDPCAGEKKRVYESVVYSSRHNRLFCITSAAEDGDNTKLELELECWDLGEGEGSGELEPPRLEQMMEFDLDSPLEKTKKLKYIVCAEHSGELYVLVRHVIDECRSDVLNAYVTLGIDVYKIERERGKVMRMEDSLEGLAMFIGDNQALALPAAEVSGVKPNSVYFTCDKRLKRPDERFGGIFDYQKRDISPISLYATHDYPVDHPVWFTPRRNLC